MLQASLKRQFLKKCVEGDEEKRPVCCIYIYDFKLSAASNINPLPEPSPTCGHARVNLQAVIGTHWLGYVGPGDSLAEIKNTSLNGN